MFPCSGIKCQAWLYVPKNTEEKPPVVLAAHGVGTCHSTLPQWESKVHVSIFATTEVALPTKLSNLAPLRGSSFHIEPHCSG